MRKTTHAIVVSGLLTALSIVLTRLFAANFMIAGIQASRLSIGFVPIMLAGMILGPWWGLAVGGLADALGFLIFPSGAYFPPITLTSALVGLTPALIARYAVRAPDWLKTLFSVTAVQILCSMLLQTYWISLLSGKAFNIFFGPRAVVALGTIPVYYVLILSLYTGLKKANLLPIYKKTTESA
jgi:ECF transporter S component (folate family)